MRIRMTLDGKTQDKLLMIMHRTLGVNESYPQKMILDLKEQQFSKFMAEVTKENPDVKLSDLNIEYLDIKKDPIRINVALRQ